MQLVEFVVERRRYALRLGVSERVVSMVAVGALPDAPNGVLGAIDVHGHVVAVFDFRRRVGLPAREHRTDMQLLLARARDRLVALPVDAVLGAIEIPAASVVDAEAIVPGLEHVAGIVRGPDGLVLIEELEAFLSPDADRQLARALAEVDR